MGNTECTRPARQAITAITILSAILAFGLAGAPGRGTARMPVRLDLEALAFEANQGQFDSEVEFVARAGNYAVGLNRFGFTVWITDPQAGCAGRLARVTFTQGGACAEGSGLEKSPTRSHYLKGADPRGWLTGVPHYRRVRYQGVYPGIDVVYYLHSGKLEYDFLLAPGADPNRIRLLVDADSSLRADTDGGVVLSAASGTFRLHKPRAYQVIEGKPVDTTAAYEIKGKELSFSLGSHLVGYPLVIDPVVSCTYLGGGGFDEALALAVDKNGHAYLAGTTDSRNLPAKTPLQGGYGGDWSDGFVAKLNPEGTEFVYVTYLGGNQTDYVSALSVDSAGRVYLAGVTESSNFPTKNPLQPALGGGMDGFAAALEPSGASLAFATFLGGSGGDMARGLSLDSSANLYVAGHTTSSNFPTLNAFQASFGGGGNDAFLCAIKNDGTGRLYSTYLGGGGADEAHAVTVNAQGEAHVVGTTSSPNFPTKNAAQPNLAGADIGDAFLARVAANGMSLVFSTYLGGSEFDVARAVALGPVGQVVITGSTESANFPHNEAPSYGGSTDAFVTVFTSAGVRTASRFLGGAGNDAGAGVQVDGSGKIWLAGTTGSTDFPVTAPEDKFKGGTGDAFLARLADSGLQLEHAQYFGGVQRETCRALTLGGGGDCFITGSTASPGLAIAGAPQNSTAGQQDAFVARISLAPTTPPGDANNDGVVSVEDVIGIVRAILLLYSPSGNADVNQDGKVTVEDVVHGTKKILQK